MKKMKKCGMSSTLCNETPIEIITVNVAKLRRAIIGLLTIEGELSSDDIYYRIACEQELSRKTVASAIGYLAKAKAIRTVDGCWTVRPSIPSHDAVDGLLSDFLPGEPASASWFAYRYRTSVGAARATMRDLAKRFPKVFTLVDDGRRCSLSMKSANAAHDVFLTLCANLSK